MRYKIRPMVDEFLYIAGYHEDDLQERRALHGLASPAARKAKNLYYRPFGFTALIAIVMAAVLAYGAAVEDWRSARLVVAVLVLGSLVVPFAVIPMMYLMGPSFVAAPLFAYVAIVSTAMTFASRRASRAVEPGAMAPPPARRSSTPARPPSTAREF